MGVVASILDFSVEQQLLRSHQVVVGLDEVGRGALAGPLCVAACALRCPVPELPPLLRDSKALSHAQRVRVAGELTGFTFGLGWVAAAEIDVYGMSRALRLGGRRALADLAGISEFKLVAAVVDGPFDFLNRPMPVPSEPVAGAVRAVTVVRGDSRCGSVAAAAVVAKLARDRYMRELPPRFGVYGFASNVGYGTRQHVAAIGSAGPTAEHRLTFASVSR